MRALAIFGLHGGLNLAVQLLMLVLVALWLALAFWTYADARRRVDDPMLVACAAAVAHPTSIGSSMRRRASA